MTDEARAVAEVAKTTAEIVRAAGGFGAYLARVFGSIPENILGLVAGDWLEHKRRRHLALLEANTARLLDGIAEDRLTEPSPSVLIPLLQAAVDEGRPELQAMWSALLANAMVDGGTKVRRDYFETLRQMEPVDALTLDIVSRRPHPNSSLSDNINADTAYVEGELRRVGLARREFNISLGKLEQLRCVKPDRVHSSFITPYGEGLLDACKPSE